MSVFRRGTAVASLYFLLCFFSAHLESPLVKKKKLWLDNAVVKAFLCQRKEFLPNVLFNYTTETGKQGRVGLLSELLSMCDVLVQASKRLEDQATAHDISWSAAKLSSSSDENGTDEAMTPTLPLHCVAWSVLKALQGPVGLEQQDVWSWCSR